MSRTLFVFRALLQVGVIVLLGVGCHLIAAYESSPVQGDRYRCEADVWDCDVQPVALTAPVTKPAASGGCYALRSGLGVGVTPYCDRNWEVREIAYPPLRGASWIAPREEDRHETSDPFLEASWSTDLQGLYLAYDVRGGVPPWLASPTYWPLRSASGQPLTLVVASPDGAKQVPLELFERVSTPPGGVRFTLPGNLHQKPAPVPSGFDPRNAAMYLVILVPNSKIDCGNVGPDDFRFTLEHGGCYQDAAGAVAGATKACRERLAGHALTRETCGPPRCTMLSSCADPAVVKEKTGLTVEPASFVRSSVIAFDAAVQASTAKVEIVGRGVYTNPVTGDLRFEYLLDDFGRMLEVRLQGLELELGSISTSGGTFSEIRVALLAPPVAKCLDASPPWASPCDAYRIAAGDLVVQQTMKLDGKPLAYAAVNALAVDLQIDHAKRLVRFQGGPLVFSTTFNDRPTTVMTTVDLAGHFRNFAPHAVARESQRTAECSWNPESGRGNATPVRLDAAGSFEIYGDPLPASAYRWIEDDGLVTEKLRGQGPVAMVPPGELSWGVHAMTLAVRDTAGVLSTDEFEIEVRDGLPPTLQVPADVFALLPPGVSSMKLGLGSPSTSDTCSPEVEVWNDAPDGGVFRPGVTDVTWKAHDGHGNVTESVQKIWVFPSAERFDPGRWAFQVAEAAGGYLEVAVRTARSAETCARIPDCGFDVSGVTTASRELVRSIEAGLEAGLAEDPEPWLELTERLVSVAGGLEEMAGVPAGAAASADRVTQALAGRLDGLAAAVGRLPGSAPHGDDG